MKIKIAIPEGLKAWFDSITPITYKLQALTGSAELTLLSQQWGLPSWWDQWVLQLNEPVFTREIVMRSHGQIYWYARTVISQTCFHADHAFFSRLTNESIRALIFDEPRVRLSKRTIYPVNQQCIEYHWAMKQKPDLADMVWVRATEYLFCNQHPFYLIELIFPELEFVAS